MHMRRLGQSGPLASAVGLGCNNLGSRLDAARSRALIHAALDAGVTHFDTAASYGDGLSERYLGAALRSRRDEATVATKFGGRDSAGLARPASAANVRRACDASLGRLGIERIDLLYLHFPDPATPFEETVGALGELVEQGKVRHIGVSNVSSAQLREMLSTAGREGRPSVAACQLEWNLLRRDAETSLVPLCQQSGVGVVPFFPLASGMLTGKYRWGEEFPAGSRFASWQGMADRASRADFVRTERLGTLAERWGLPLSRVALAWLLSKTPVTSVIAGATSPEQVLDNIGAVGLHLSEEQLSEIDAAAAEVQA